MRLRNLLFLSAIAGAVGTYMKKQRERELDEAIWEEPRDLTAVPGTADATTQTTEAATTEPDLTTGPDL